jgi:hypothetical protein
MSEPNHEVDTTNADLVENSDREMDIRRRRRHRRVAENDAGEVEPTSEEGKGDEVEAIGSQAEGMFSTPTLGPCQN